MRINNRIITYVACALLVGVFFHIVINTINNNDIDWSGIGSFILGVAGLLTGTYGAKAVQKKYENNNK